MSQTLYFQSHHPYFPSVTPRCNTWHVAIGNDIYEDRSQPGTPCDDGIESTWMATGKWMDQWLGPMVDNLLINGVYWGCNPLILTIDPNFLAHPSKVCWILSNFPTAPESHHSMIACNSHTPFFTNRTRPEKSYSQALICIFGGWNR